MFLPNKSTNIFLWNPNFFSKSKNTLGYGEILSVNIALLFLSGFYKNDIPMIQEVCVDYNLSLEAQISKNDWVALKFKIN